MDIFVGGVEGGALFRFPKSELKKEKDMLCLHSLFLVLWTECLCLPSQDSYVEILIPSKRYLEVGPLGFN